MARLSTIETKAIACQTKRDSEPSVQSLDWSDIKVLVVENDPGTRDLIAFALEQYKADVEAVESAEQALLSLAQSKPDILGDTA